MSGAMKTYVVRQGDYLEKLANQLGFDAGSVWNAGENAELRAKRRPEQLCPGDVLHVPDPDLDWQRLEAGTSNRYRARVPRVLVNLVFERDGKPDANQRCVIEGLGAPVETTTDGQGRLVVRVPVIIREFSVRFVERNVVHAVQVGDMDPIEEASGVAKRLVHLGYLAERLQDDAAELSSAIARFQKAQELPATGAIDDRTRDALETAHGS